MTFGNTYYPTTASSEVVTEDSVVLHTQATSPAQHTGFGETG